MRLNPAGLILSDYLSHTASGSPDGGLVPTSSEWPASAASAGVITRQQRRLPLAIKVSLLVNCDDAVIFWIIPKPIPDCWGFMIEKEAPTADGSIVRSTLENRMGFEIDRPKVGERRFSNIWPFQRFWWADYTANLGEKIRYRVTPMVHTQGKLRELVSERSDWTDWATLSGGDQDGFSSYFNRGLVISQFMSRYLEDLRVKNGLKTRRDALKMFKDSLEEHELSIRKFLSGALRVEILRFLREAKTSNQNVYAALYELDDEELIEALGALGPRAHVVLANGSIQQKNGETAAEARVRDQNKDGRQALQDSGVEVFGRFVSPGALGHNKFLVFTDSSNEPKAAWTGSTNWTSTGLCTQVNNGLFIQNSGVATAYLDQWKRLRDAKNSFPEQLVNDNDIPVSFGIKGKASSGDIWFTRTHKKVDLTALDAVVNSAKEGVLFLMFQPGGTGTLATIRKLQTKTKSLYIKGVVSTLPSEEGGQEADDGDQVSVAVYDSGKKSAGMFDIVQPEGTNKFANWAATVTRSEFITRQGGVIGFAIVHSKLIVVDPFTNPVVVTGSHNFSGSASQKNDDNFIIVRGNQELALHYATHILSVYHHYSWLAYLKTQQGKGKGPSGYLRENDEWQAPKLSGSSKQELDFWIR